MSGQWQHSSSEGLDRAGSALAALWQFLSQPERARRIRQLVALLLLLWIALALAELFWSFLPRSGARLPPESVILNPMESRQIVSDATPVDIEAMTDWHLFGEAGAEAVTPSATQAQVSAATGREGIEDGARETRLDLKLRGVVSASEDGLGHAMIEHRSRQDVYAVGDKLPVNNRVSLAKVLPDSVVLDNAGTYELLKLYDETRLLNQLPEKAPNSAPARKADKKALNSGPAAEADKTTIARTFRQQLYENPQSLAEVVRVSAVRENNALKGYRVDPGKSGSQFTQLGFKAGDVVTSVNGITLDNPGNAMQLYQLMRSASEAVFDLERGDERMTLTVNLDEAPRDG